MQHWRHRVADAFQAGDGVLQVVVGVLEAGAEFGPFHRHGDGCGRFGAGGEGGDQELAVAVLEVVDVDLAVALAHGSRDGADVRRTADDDAGEQFAQRGGLAMGQLAGERQQDVQAACAARLQEAGQVDFVEQRLHGLGGGDDVGERSVLRVQVEHAPIWMFQIGDAAVPGVDGDGAHVG